MNENYKQIETDDGYTSYIYTPSKDLFSKDNENIDNLTESFLEKLESLKVFSKPKEIEKEKDFTNIFIDNYYIQIDRKGHFKLFDENEELIKKHVFSTYMLRSMIKIFNIPYEKITDKLYLPEFDQEDVYKFVLEFIEKNPKANTTKLKELEIPLKCSITTIMKWIKELQKRDLIVLEVIKGCYFYSRTEKTLDEIKQVEKEQSKNIFEVKQIDSIKFTKEDFEKNILELAKQVPYIGIKWVANIFTKSESYMRIILDDLAKRNLLILEIVKGCKIYSKIGDK